MPRFELNINGTKRTVETDPERPLLEVIREEFHLTGTKYGCGEGQCRACTVLIDGKPTASCITSIRAAQGRHIATIESLATDGKLHAVQQAFIDEDAMQCGYCVPGMILATVALLRTHPKPSEEQTIAALNGNLCRCCGYPRILAAVKRASGASHA